MVGSAGKSISIQPSSAGEQTQLAASGVECPGATEHVGGGQGGVTAQVHLGRGSEPPQVMRAVGAGNDEGRLRQVHLAGDRLHAALVRKGVHHGNGGRVAGEGTIGEGIDDDEVHGSRYAAPGTRSDGPEPGGRI